MWDIKRYWQEIRAIEKGLPEYVWLVSIADEIEGRAGGDLVEASAEVAAKLLHAKSHRVATKEEIEGRRAAESAARMRISQEELRRRGIAQVALGGGRDGSTQAPRKRQTS